jgi:hypothetical protein
MSILWGGQNPPELILLADLKTSMGAAAGVTLLEGAPSAAWLQRGQLGMGTRLHWDSSPDYWGDALTDYIGSNAPVAGEDALFAGDGTYGAIVGFWTDIVPWYVVWPGVNNTNTNGIVEVVGINAYLLNNVDWTWELIGNTNGQQRNTAQWGDTSNPSSKTTAAVAGLYGRLPGFSFNDGGTNRFVHGYGVATFSANAENVAALVTTAKIRIVPPFGQTLDGVVEYYANVGMDPYPKNLRLSTSVVTWDGYGANTTPLAGPGYQPSCGNSKLHLLTTDGTFTRISCASLAEGQYYAGRSYVGSMYTADSVFEEHPLYTQQVAAL